ncbi:MAG: hypothetical protein M0C28_47885 [Candidatus Moduliflexus flocculans]|nr:hypothetical protein [Candidatus Moduliflexus flocculans]
MPKIVEPPGETQERLPHRLRDRGPAGPREGLHRRPDRARLGGLVARPLPPDALPRPADARRARAVERRRLLGPRDQAGRGLRRLPARPGEAPARRRRRARSRSSPRRSTTWAGRPRSRPCPSTSRSGRARSGPEAAKYPLSAIGHHYLSRVHSTLEGDRLARGGLPAAPVHQSRRRRRTARSRPATRSRSGTTAAPSSSSAG